MPATSSDRGHFGSGLGFILAAAGSAVGLGNIWRFPYVTGENGGGAFVFVYLLCILFIGLPLLFNEITLGRITQKNPVGAFNARKRGSAWILAPFLSLLLNLVVLSYYGVIAGWTIGYIFTSITSTTVNFNEFAATPLYAIPLFGVFIFLTILIVRGGVEKGIEKWSKVLMPTLLVLIIVVVVRSVTLDGAMAGINYYLNPDFSKINGEVILEALGQAFFSLSVGWGLMITYGSYLHKNTNIISSSIYIAIADTLVAFLGGLMVFPAVFAFNMDPAAGPSLVFETLPKVFEQMPGGPIVGAGFFLLLCVAALTSSISILEVPVSYVVDEKGKARNYATILVATIIFVIGIPSALSNGAVESLTNITLFGSTGLLNILDFIFGTVAIVLFALLACLFTGWATNIREYVDEIEQGAPSFKQRIIFGLSPAQIWVFFIRIVCPVVISLVLLKQVLGIFGIELF